MSDTSYPRDRIRITLLENPHPAAAEALTARGFSVELIPRALEGDELREVIAASRYVANGNWKIPSENFAGDHYHTPTTHGSSFALRIRGSDGASVSRGGSGVRGRIGVRGRGSEWGLGGSATRISDSADLRMLADQEWLIRTEPADHPVIVTYRVRGMRHA